MNPLRQRLRLITRLAGLTLGVASLMALEVSAEPVRIVSWNLSSLGQAADRNASLDARLNSAALALAKLKPDVVLLQEVPDWKTAADLASRIDARFGVRICSAYERAAGGRSSRQMAVLSHFKSSITFHESWQGVPGEGGLGFAFAMIEIQGKQVGFASLVLPDATAPDQSAGRLVAAGQFFAKLAEIRGWKERAPFAFIFGGTLAGGGGEFEDAVLQRAREEGYVSAFLNLPPEARITLRARESRPALATDHVYAEGGGYSGFVQLAPNIVSDHSILSVDWDPDRSMPIMVAAPPAMAAAPAGNAPGAGRTDPAGAPVQASVPVFGIDLKWWVLGLGGAVLVLMVLILRRPAPRAFDPSHALPPASGDKILFLTDTERAQRTGNQPPLLTDAERRHVRPHLLRWLKEAFIGGLLRQRSEMINVHDTAARQADDLGKRMEQIQDNLIGRIHKAEGRVSELERELAVAKSENRELIQANLLLAQRELAEARAKIASQGGRAG